MAFTGHTTWYTSSNKFSSVTQWATGQAKVVGDLIRASGTPTAGNERVWVCTVAGTTGGGADPLTTFTRGVIISDNGVSWQEITGIPAINGDMTNTPTWTTGAKNTAITLGHVIKSDDGTKILICTVAGTAGNGAEPTWGTTTGVDIADGATLKWKLLKTGSAVFANWAAPHQRLRNTTASTWGGTIGTKYFVGNSHAATENTNISPLPITIGSITAPLQCLCVSESGSMPPVSADLTTGASEQSGASGTIDLNGYWYIYGMTFDMTGTGNRDLKIGSASGNGEIFLDSCTLKLSSASSTASAIAISAGTLTGRKVFRDCSFVFAHVNQAIQCGGYIEMLNCTFAGTGTVPTYLFGNVGGTGAISSHTLICIGCDFTNINTVIIRAYNPIVTTVLLDGCKTHASVTILSNAGQSQVNNMFCTAVRCSSDTKTNKFFSSYFEGTVASEFTAVRTTGAADNSVAYALKMSSNANINGGTILNAANVTSPWFSQYNTSIDPTTVTATIYGIIFAAALPTQFDVNADVEYLGSASTPLLSRKTSRPTQLDATASLTSDTSAWDSVATSRANGHVYALGDIIKTSSTPDKIFICTTAGTSAGSEPGGFTSAADGASITDNTAVFRTCNRFKIAITLSSPKVQLPGLIMARVSLNKASVDVYIDPLLVLT